MDNAKKRLYLSYEYNEEFEEYRENIRSIKNEEGSIEYSYDDDIIGQCKSIQTNDHIKTNFLYDCINRLTGIIQENQENHISYDTIGNIASLSDNDSYQYEISNDTTKSSVTMKCNEPISKQILSETNMDYHNHSIEFKDSMLGTNIRIYNNKYGQPIKYCFNGENTNSYFMYQEIGNELTSDGLTNYFDESLSIANIKRITCPFTNNVYRYKYDNKNQLKEYEVTNNNNTLISINKENVLSTKIKIGEKEFVFSKEFNKNPFQRKIIKTKIGTSNDNEISKYTYTYEYHPIIGTISKRIGGNSIREVTYERLDNVKYYATSPQHIIQKYGNNSFDIEYYCNQSGDIIRTFGAASCSSLTSTYSYDKNHRISKEGYVYLNVDYSYEYNQYNRLERVYRNKEVIKEFSYDKMGRLTSMNDKEHSIINIDYEDTNTLYPSKIGNNSCKFERNGLLSKYGSNTYEYDYSGLRHYKRTSNKTVKYYYINGNLFGEDYSDNTKIRYMYDQEGITGARYYCDNQVIDYEYVKDGYNNVIAIVKDDTIVASYVYDSWGNILKEETNGDPFAQINPIRYRSYYYDIDTELYYLQSRYYKPAIGAFISPDSTDYLDPETIGGLNLYAYCNNNPVMGIDPTGHFWDTVLDIFSIGWSLYDLIKNPSWENAGWLALDIGFAVVPFLTGSGGLKAVTKMDDLYDLTKVTASADNIYVLGQTMGSRVIPEALNLGADWYHGFGYYDDLAKVSKSMANLYGYADNMAFIANKAFNGAKFIDMGLDATRTLSGAYKSGKFGVELLSRFTIYSERFVAIAFRKKNIARFMRRIYQWL